MLGGFFLGPATDGGGYRGTNKKDTVTLIFQTWPIDILETSGNFHIVMDNHDFLLIATSCYFHGSFSKTIWILTVSQNGELIMVSWSWDGKSNHDHHMMVSSIPIEVCHDIPIIFPRNSLWSHHFPVTSRSVCCLCCLHPHDMPTLPVKRTWNNRVVLWWCGATPTLPTTSLGDRPWP